MKAAVTHVINGTTATFVAEGPYIQVQQFPDGSAILTVRDKQYGARMRVIHVVHAELVDLDYRPVAE